MSKVKINLKLNDFHDTIDGILNGNQLKFLLDKKVVTLRLEDNMIMMKRMENNQEYTFIRFCIEHPEAYYYFNQKFPLNIRVNKLNVKNNQIEINYEIEEQLFIFKLEYEEGEL